MGQTKADPHAPYLIGHHHSMIMSSTISPFRRIAINSPPQSASNKYRHNYHTHNVKCSASRSSCYGMRKKLQTRTVLTRAEGESKKNTVGNLDAVLGEEPEKKEPEA